MNYIEENYKLLNEQYYGKNPILLKIEKEFDEIIKIIKNKKDTGNFIIDGVKDLLSFLSTEELNQVTQHAKKIEQLSIEMFNFKSLKIYIVNYGMFNATSLCKEIITANFFLEKEVGPNGLRYIEKKRNCIIGISLELLGHEKMTGSIATAIYLHEIGHTFYYEKSLLFLISRLELADAAIDLFKTILKHDGLISAIYAGGIFGTVASNLGKGVLNNTVDKVENKYIKSAIHQMTNIALSLYLQIKIFKDRAYVASNYLDLMKKSFSIDRFIGFFKNPMTIITNLVGSQDELFADNFATSYGYGPEIAAMSSIFLESSATPLLDILNKNFVTSYVLDVIEKSLKIMPNPFVSRVSEPTRIIDQINYLEANLSNTSYSSEQRKAITTELNQVKKLYKDLERKCTTMDDDSLLKQGKVITALLTNRDFFTKGELGYHINKPHYDKKGNWKNLI